MRVLRNSKIWIVIFILITVSFFSFPAHAKYGGGTGEPNDPYLIYTAEHLNTIGAEPNDWDKHFKLMSDIDLLGMIYDGALIAPDKSNVEPGFQGTAFIGLFNGNGLSIFGLTIEGAGYLGLFGQLEAEAEVKNLSVEDVNIIGLGDHIGGLAGFNASNSIVLNCHATGNVSGKNQVAGLVGDNSGVILNCDSEVNANGDFDVGSLVGRNYKGLILKCNAKGNVSRSRNVGGLVGSNVYGKIMYCHATGSVVSDDRPSGGLLGYNDGQVFGCYATGIVTGSKDVGGLVGMVGGNVYSDNEIRNCYASGDVNGINRIGGLVGWNWGTISNSYSVGEVKPLDDDNDDVNDIGGLLGKQDGTCYNSFWDIETSGQEWSACGTGLPTDKMKDPNTYLDAGWDFVGEMENGAHDIWRMPDKGDYPEIVILDQLQGTGTPEEPYLLSNAMELRAMNQCNPYAHYRLVTSIDLYDIRWKTAVIPWFAGTFEGNGLAISGITIEGAGYLGLFGRLDTGAEVKNLSIIDVNIVGFGNYVGGLVGENNGDITQCYSTGVISGIESIGGLVGSNAQSGIVANSYNTSEVNGNWHFGGLVGSNGGVVIHCYSNGPVNGIGDIGGLVGYGRLQADDPLGSDIVGDVTDSFWDIETSGS